MTKKVADYILMEKISETRNSIVYRGKRENESYTVIIKILNAHFPAPSEIARFKREFNLVKSLNVDGIVKVLDILPYEHTYAIIEEDFNGITLRTLLNGAPINLSSFLQIALKLAEILGILHWNHIVHLDIKPDNILINQKEQKIKITDFGISAVLTHAYEELYNPHVIMGTLPYMSPEQTGRMNRSIDYRTDLYSLGITFYEMLTGAVPFRSDDPMELIHSHIAREPQPPDEVNPAVPGIISRIILKLLAKTPEERYQNSMGLMADIGECIKRSEATGEIGDFRLATEDIPLKFNIPQILVGREAETGKLISAFERAAQGKSEIMLVLGEPGIGKSELVNAIHKPIVARRGYFIAGKYDQFKKDIPYSAFIQAFQGLIRQLLAENEERIASWKERLITALGPNGKIITSVIPKLELIIGKQPEVPELGFLETENRFRLVFLDFIRVFTAETHPLALFLDDLQWADPASLNLLKEILTDKEMEFFFLTGTYRNDELTSDHPLAITLEEIKDTGWYFNSITLKPLDITGVSSIIKETLRCDAEKAAPIARLVHEKTAGNPFFVFQFLKKLYDHQLIELNPRSGWQWDTGKIKELQITDNMADFLADKINNLPRQIQDLLKIGSCIGNRFDLETVSFITGKSLDDTLSDLAVAIQEQLVSHDENMFKFHHGRIRESAYCLIPAHEKAEMHYKIGTNALNKTGEGMVPENIFYIADQLNRGMTLLKDNEERTRLARLNLIAGEKAVKSIAYDSALHYLKTGIELLPENSWEKDYPLTYNLYINRIECEYSTFHFEEAIKTFHTILAKAANNIDKLHAYTIMVSLFTSRGNYKEAVNLGREGMSILGIKLPEQVTIGMILVSLVKLYFRFRKRKIEDILAMPFAADQTMLAYHALLVQMGEAAYLYNMNLFFYFVIEGTVKILKYGLHKEAAVAFSTLAIIIGPVLGFYDRGYKFGEMALRLNDKLKSSKSYAKTRYIFYFFLFHWKKHLKIANDVFHKLFKRSREMGDLFFASNCIRAYFLNRLILGDNIDEVLDEFLKYRDFMVFYASDTTETIHHICLCLKGLTDKRGSLNSGDFDEEKQRQVYQAEESTISVYLYSVLKVQINYLFRLYRDCIPLLPELKTKNDIGGPYFAVANFYSSLIITAVYNEAGAGERGTYKRLLKQNQRKMKLWSTNCPENFLHKYLLVEAEWARIRGRHQEAKELYAAAVKSAHENSYTQYEGIANERAALFMLELNDRESADAFLKAARHCYVLWGAADKVKQLDEIHPALFADQSGAMPGTGSKTTINSGTTRTDKFDLVTIVKTSQSLSGEIEIEKLLRHIMKLFIENAGAQHGFLILEKEEDNKLYIEGTGKIDETAGVLESTPLEGNKSLCTAIVAYVYKTGENIVLDNAAEDPRFINDPYIMEHKPKSIICIPIKSKGKVTGIIYLENNLTTCAFTPDRIELLQVLSTQAAISIENSRLMIHRENAAKLETEMHLARNIQTVLLPGKPEIRGFEITACMEPAESIGGDYYDVINADSANWIIIGDVSGHGMPAGLVMMMVQTSIHTILNKYPDMMPSDLLSWVNRTITGNIKLLGNAKYMTITALALKENGLVTFAGAHLDILVYRAGSGNVEIIETQGIWIGIEDDITGILQDNTFTLETGDVMLLYTDGIIEAFLKDKADEKSTEEKLFGLKKLIEIFSTLGKEAPRDVVDGLLAAFKKDYTAEDDVSLVVVKRINDR